MTQPIPLNLQDSKQILNSLPTRLRQLEDPRWVLEEDQKRQIQVSVWMVISAVLRILSLNRVLVYRDRKKVGWRMLLRVKLYRRRESVE